MEGVAVLPVQIDQISRPDDLMLIQGLDHPAMVQRIRTDIDAHLKTYHSLRQQLTDTTPTKKTTEITRVCDEIDGKLNSFMDQLILFY